MKQENLIQTPKYIPLTMSKINYSEKTIMLGKDEFISQISLKTSVEVPQKIIMFELKTTKGRSLKCGNQ